MSGDSSADGVRPWLEAASALNILVSAPFELTHDGRRLVFTVFLPHFGSANGMVAWLGTQHSDDHWSAAKAHNLYYSQLWPSYAHFSDELFRETLDDWGYFGPDEHRPSWYTGRPWTG